MTDDATEKAENDDMDSRVLDCISRGIAKAKKIEHETSLHFRAVDKALQRLRKAGRITYEGPVQGWKLTPAQA
jgi:phosphomevalonate kinase